MLWVTHVNKNVYQCKSVQHSAAAFYFPFRLERQRETERGEGIFELNPLHKPYWNELFSCHKQFAAVYECGGHTVRYAKHTHVPTLALIFTSFYLPYLMMQKQVVAPINLAVLLPAICSRMKNLDVVISSPLLIYHWLYLSTFFQRGRD